MSTILLHLQNYLSYLFLSVWGTTSLAISHAFPNSISSLHLVKTLDIFCKIVPEGFKKILTRGVLIIPQLGSSLTSPLDIFKGFNHVAPSSKHFISLRGVHNFKTPFDVIFLSKTGHIFTPSFPHISMKFSCNIYPGPRVERMLSIIRNR